MTLESVSRPTFCLDRDAWIPVLYADGSRRDVSLRELFRDAHLIRDITPAMAQQKLPLLRLALAVLYHRYAYPSSERQPDEITVEMKSKWLDIWNEGRFCAEDIDRYFDEYSDRFDLFDPERPFYQTAGLQYLKERADGCPYDPISMVIADVPNKPEKFLMSMRARNMLGDISFAEAARWLVYLQAYDCAGIKTPVCGNTSVRNGRVYTPKDAVSTGWLGEIGGVFLKGETLFDTLMLNWVIACPDSGDSSFFTGAENLPAWDCAHHEATTDIWEADVHGFRPGPAALYTWQARRVRLVPNDEGTAVMGIVSCYGDIPPKPVDYQFLEPMTAWRGASPAEQKKFGFAHVPFMPARHAAGRSLWRGFAALLALDKSGDDRRPGVIRWLDTLNKQYGESPGAWARPLPAISLYAQGVIYDVEHRSVVVESVCDSFDVAVSLRSPKLGVVNEVARVIAQAEDCIRALVSFVRSVNEIAGNRHGDSSSDSVREQAYGELDELFRTYIAHMPQVAVAGYVDEWRAQVHRKMLAMGERYLCDSGASWFVQHDSSNKKASSRKKSTEEGPKNVSEAIYRYHGCLNRCLEPLPRRADSGGVEEADEAGEGR